MNWNSTVSIINSPAYKQEISYEARAEREVINIKRVYVLVDKEDYWVTVYSSKEKLEKDFYDDMISEGYDNFDDYYEGQLKQSYYIDCVEVK